MNISVIFGIILIALGGSYILGAILHIHIPVFSILFGLLLLYLGVQLMSGAFHRKESCWRFGKNTTSSGCYSTFMGEGRVTLDEAQMRAHAPFFEYGTVFGATKIDLSKLEPAAVKSIGTPLIFTINTVFGKTELLTRSDIPTRIETSCAFGKTELPDQSKTSFGSYTFQSSPSDQPLIIIKTSTVFGDLEVVHYTPTATQTTSEAK